MKLARTIAYSSIIAIVSAQSLESLPDCGKLCVSNMLAKSKELGCADGDTACLCKNIDFAFGLRDCSHEVCGPEQAVPVVAYGSNYCKGASQGNGTDDNNDEDHQPSITKPLLMPGPSSVSSGSSSSATDTKSMGMNPSMSGVPNSSLSNEPIVTIISSDGDVKTSTIGFLTSSSKDATPTSRDGDNQAKTIPPSNSPTPSSGDDNATSSSSAGAAKQTFFAGLAAAAGLAAMVI